MTRAVLVVLALLTIAVPALAETQPAAWTSHRAIADWTSTGLVGAQLAADTIHAWRIGRWRAIGCVGARIGASIAASETTKRLVTRERPDRSDARSFPSEHAMLATVAAGWRLEYGIPIAFGASYGRAAANKHYWSDIASGIGAGIALQFICHEK